MSHATYLEQLDRERIIAVQFAGSREWSRLVHLLTTVLHLPSDTAEKIANLTSDLGNSTGNAGVTMDGG